MHLFTQYLYLWGSLVALLLFAGIFYCREDLRRRMVRAGIFVGIGGVIAEFAFFQDYWQPPLVFRFGPFGGIEDFLFGFAAGGVGTALYLVVCKRTVRRTKHVHRWALPFVVITQLISFAVLWRWLGINSIYASAAGFAVPAILMIAIRRDLLQQALAAAILCGTALALGEMTMLVFAPSYLRQYYMLFGKAPLILGIVPVTEFIWGAAFGLMIGPLAEFKNGDVTMPAPTRNMSAARRSS